MAAVETLDALLDRATTPIPGHPDADTVIKICAKIRRLSEGPSDATIVLLEKIRHKNVAVALKALQILDAAVKNCGPPIHNIVGKFRFLNEFIKMVSPKYFTNTPPEVQQKILALLQRWNFNLPGQPKIHEAYHMLKSQGLIFPTVVPTDYLNVPCGEGFLDVNAESFSERKSPLEQDENKSKMLAKLLQSKDPNDLARANKLIKKMVVEDEKRTERDTKLRGDLETVTNNVRVLGDMLANFNPAVDGRLEQNDVIQDLFAACSQMRPRLFTLAGELNDKDPLFGEVLAHNDELTRVLDQYNRVKASQPATGIAGLPPPAVSRAPVPGPASAAASAFLSSYPSASPAAAAATAPSIHVSSTPTSAAARQAADGDCSLIDFDLAPPRAAPVSAAAQLEREFVGLDLGPLKAAAPAHPANFASFPGGSAQAAFPAQQQYQQHQHQQQQQYQQQQQQQQQQHNFFNASFPSQQAPMPAPAPATSRLPDLFGGSAMPSLPMPTIPGLMPQGLPYSAASHPSVPAPAAFPAAFPSSNPLSAPAPTLAPVNLLGSLAPASAPAPAPAASVFPGTAAAADGVDVSSLVVTVDAVRPTEHAPITAYDKNNLRVLLHICRAPGIPASVAVLLVSFANAGTLPISRINFQAAVPKTLQIKLLPPSGADLPPFNPIHSPTALTQIILLGNPAKAPVRLRFKLSFVVSGQEISDQGDLASFPSL